MMLSSKEFIVKNTSIREGETKLGQVLECIESDVSDNADLIQKIQNFKGDYVLLGVSEDIGVRGNYGVKGARNGYKNFLKYFINTQSNSYQNPKNVLLIGEVDVSEAMNKSDIIDDVSTYRELCQEVDEKVAKVVEAIVKAGKIPIVIGGGHNNSYPIIKGVSKALSKKINVLNIDPHCDFRKLEGRHSGNGFSYAYEEGFLEKYTVFGMHPYYNNQYMIDKFEVDENLNFVKLESSDDTTFLDTLSNLSNEYGLEIDLDSIVNFPTSAISSVGFSTKEVRALLRISLKNKLQYIHLAESSPIEGQEYINGKFIATLVCDIITKNSI